LVETLTIPTHLPTHIRRALPEESEIIATITYAAYEKYVPLLGRKPQPMTADYRQMIADHSVWLLEIEEKPSGALVLMFLPDHILIYSVAVHPSFQKQGLGKVLLTWAEEQARQAGLPLLRLYTNEKMVENIGLYRSLGYEETGREGYLGGALVHMAKRVV
jgi:ribosomal protein S18 acetylase RimI-like enzyme